MTDQGQDKKKPGLGLYLSNGPGERITPAEVIAVALSLVWLLGCAVFFVVLGTGDDSQGGLRANPVNLVMILLAIFMPVAIIWVAAAATRSARIMREESTRLQAAIEGMRHTFLQQQQSGVLTVGKSNVEKKLDQIAQAQKQTETAIATFTSTRPGTMPAAPGDTRPAIATDAEVQDQASLALGTPAEALDPPLSIADYIRALHFPETAEDAAGFNALRRALQDHRVSGLIQAAQDVLTLLSEDGIYMDDLRPDRARPEIWRKFAAGERGRAVAALGGVRDRSSLALTAGRMRNDTIFRDSVHHFLRKFDQSFATFESNASDQDISDLADTRTARAFMLLGRVTGTFD